MSEKSDKIEKEVIEFLNSRNSSSNFKDFEQWIKSLDREELKGIIIGCASFILDNSTSRMFLKDKLEKRTAKHNVKIAESYLNYAKQVFYTLDDE